jgi:hypothetical protein
MKVGVIISVEHSFFHYVSNGEVYVETEVTEPTGEHRDRTIGRGYERISQLFKDFVRMHQELRDSRQDGRSPVDAKPIIRDYFLERGYHAEIVRGQINVGGECDTQIGCGFM